MHQRTRQHRMLKNVVCEFAGIIIAFLSLMSSAAASTTLTPTGVGYYNQWTPNEKGLVNFKLVNEAVCDGLTTYNSSTTSGQRDSYAVSLSSVPSGYTITGIHITPCASHASNIAWQQVQTMKVFYRYNNTNYDAASSYSVTGKTPVVLSTTDFTGLSIPKSNTTNIEIGALDLGGTGGGLLLSQIVVYFDYVAPPPPPTPPSEPNSFNGVVNSDGSVQLTWGSYPANALPNGFDLYTSTDGLNYSYLRSLTPGTFTNYLDIPGVHGFYSYELDAYNVYGTSPRARTDVFLP